MSGSGKKSERVWDIKWRKALSEGRCLEGCELGSAKHPCEHLNQYLKMNGQRKKKRITVLYTDDIESLASEEVESPRATEGVFRFFLDLRTFGLMNDEILLLIDHIVLKKPLRDIQTDRGWTSYGTMHRRLKDALEKLKKRGYRG